MLEKYKYKNLDEMYAAVGFGANSPVKSNSENVTRI